jgi:hypothetical protein
MKDRNFTSSTIAPNTTMPPHNSRMGMSGNSTAPDVENGKAHDPATDYPDPEGHQFCGCCCDMRKAVAICDALGIAITVFLYSDVFSALTIPLVVATCACFSLGIYGAMTYKIWPVVVALLAYIFQIALATYFSGACAIALNLLFAYPHVMFIIEVSKGVLTKENYPNVDYCC